MQRFHRFRFVLLILAIPIAAVSFGQEAAESDTGETPSSESGFSLSIEFVYCSFSLQGIWEPLNAHEVLS